MKNIKKIFGLLFAFVFSLMQVNADETALGSITINKAIVDENYTIYRVLDLETYDKANNHYIYRANSNFKSFIDSEEGKKYLEAKNDDGTGETYYVWKEGVNVKEFSDKVYAYIKEENIEEVDSKKATTTTVKFENLPLGYYLVNTTTGSLLNLTTTNPDANVNEKNTITPDVDKKVKENTADYGTKNDANIGEEVEFKATITTGAGYTDYVLKDKMSDGLTFNSDSIKVYYKEALVDSSNYTVNTNVNGYTFTITFDNDYIAKLPRNSVITVTYTAILNDKAVVEGEGNPNKIILSYKDDNQTEKNTDEKITITYTYAFDLVKNDKDDNQLEGAEFKLLDKDKNEIKLVFDSENNVYRVATSDDSEEDITTITAGKVTVEGLDAGTYYLEEIKAPVGYNKLTSPVQFTITGVSDNNTYSRVSNKVTNYTGSQLPETGGMGTTLFLTLGSTMIIVFGLLLVTKLRAYKENI